MIDFIGTRTHVRAEGIESPPGVLALVDDVEGVLEGGSI